MGRGVGLKGDESALLVGSIVMIMVLTVLMGIVAGTIVGGVQPKERYRCVGYGANKYIEDAVEMLEGDNCLCGECEIEIGEAEVSKDVEGKYLETIEKLEEIEQGYRVDAENCRGAMHKHEGTFRAISETIKAAQDKEIDGNIKVYEKILDVLEKPHTEITGYDIVGEVLSKLDGLGKG